MRCSSVAILAIVVLAPTIAIPNDEVVYTRADILSATLGEVELRRAYAARLALPGVECDGEPLSCGSDTVYGQVYSIAFSERRIVRREDGTTEHEFLPRGGFVIALDLSPEEEDEFEDALVGHLERLEAPSFARPRAGMSYINEPLTQRRALQSAQPAWICKEAHGRYSGDIVISDEDGNFVRSQGVGGDSADRGCRSIDSATREAAVEFFGTMPAPLALVHHTVRLRTASTLSGLTWADELAPIPAEVTFDKSSTGKKTGGIRDLRDGVYVGHEGRYHDVQRDVRLPAASLRLVEAPMWIARWSFESARQSYGTQPGKVSDPPTSIVTAVIPITDTVMPNLTRSSIPLYVPDGPLVGEVIGRLGRSATLGPTVVEWALTKADIWPASGDWLVVSCLDDGSARYGIAPFAGAAKVTNPRAACAAIVRELGE